jgi:hypothetical protein
MIQTIQTKFPSPIASANVPSKAELEHYFDSATLPELPSKPDLRGLVNVFISDSRILDGSRIDAWVNPKTCDIYKQVTGAGMGGPQTIGPFWFGPGKLGKPGQLTSKEKLSTPFDGGDFLQLPAKPS